MKLNHHIINEHIESTIVFIHGNSCSLKSFIKQRENADLLKFRLIFIDLPGHGDSPKSDNYSLPALGKILSDFILALKIEKYFLVGHSFGGHVVGHSLNHLNPVGICLFGTPPIRQDFDPSSFLPNEHAAILFKEHPSIDEITSFGQESQLSDEFMSMLSNDFLNTDPAFRASLFVNISNHIYNNELQLLENFPGKILIIISTQDSFINNDYILASVSETKENHSIQYMKANHYPHLDHYNEFNKILSDYILHSFM